MEKISAFIIAKNEEAKIETALKSLVSFCDEVILVDTGSTDRTKEIALNYTDRIYDFKWIDDFSAARNFALSKCSGNWIIYLDADDELSLPSQNSLKKLIQQTDKNTVGFYVNYQYAQNKDQLMPRVFKNGFGLKFKMPVHEYLDIPKNLQEKFQAHPEIEIVHHKEAKENISTLKRNVAILEKASKKEPGNSHIKFFLGRDYYNLGENKKALSVFSELAEDKSIKDQSFIYNVYLHLGRSHEKLQEFHKAIECYKKAHEFDERFAEPLIYEANILLYHLRKIGEAKKLYKKSLTIPLPKTTFPINHTFYHDYPRNQLHKIEQLKKPIALVCGYYGQLNIGDELMLASIVQNLSKKYRIIVASYNTQITQKLHNVESVPHKHKLFDQALQQSEIMIIGGGTLFHDQGLEENKNVEYYCGLIEKAAALNKKIVLLGVGIDTLKLNKNKEYIKKSLAKCKYIFVRDQDSKKKLMEYGISENKIGVVPDLIFGLDITKQKSPKGKKPLIGISLCSPIQNDPKNLLSQIEKYLPAFIRDNKDKFEFKFIPGLEVDMQYLPYFRKKFGIELSFFKPDLNNYFNSYFQIVNSCDYLIASRYHMLLLGALMNIPTFAISYAEKTDTLLKEFPDQIKPFKGKLENDFKVIERDKYKQEIDKYFIA